MMPETPIVHLVDDDASFLSAMSRFLRASGFSVERYQSARDFLTRRRSGTPGCVLVDLQMPELSGLDLQAVLSSSPDPLPIVFLTAHGDIPTSVRAMRRGAEDFLTKRAPKEELLTAVKRALERDLRERAERAHLQELRGRLESLSPREREVLGLVVQGKLNKEIASELGIHERTVKLHRTAITTKLHVQSVAQLTRLAQAAGILP
jgi:two-component system, LuxR family, response regulator FixJ